MRRMGRRGLRSLNSDSTFSPLDLGSALEAWFKADAITGLSDDAAVATWPDSSGNGKDVTQATESAKPIYKTNILNGKPVVRFRSGGNDSTLEQASFVLGLPATAFVVGKYGVGAGGLNQRFFDDGAGAGRMLIGRQGANTAIIYSGIEVKWTSAGTGAGGAADDTFFVFSGIFSNSAAGLIASNGTTGASGDTGNQTLTSLALGSNSGASEFLWGDIAEVILCSGQLSEADISSVEQYLGSKYAITIA